MGSIAVSRRFDALWLLGTLLAPVIFYALYRWGTDRYFVDRPQEAVLFFFTLFTAIFDAPHIFVTLVRSHGDRDEFMRRRRLHMTALPLAIAISVGSLYLGYENYFLTFFGLYGSWHIIRQNIGFVHLYHRSEIETRGNRAWEVYWMYALLAFYVLHEKNSVREFFASRPHIVPPTLLVALQVLAGVALTVFAILIIWRNFQIYKKVGQWPAVKLGFLFGTGALFIWLAQVGAHPLILTAVGTIAHDLQYQGWIWHYQSQRRSAFAARLALSASLVTGLLFGLAMADRYLVFGILLPIAAIYNGFVLWHYFIDGYVWRFRDSPEIRNLLNQRL